MFSQILAIIGGYHGDHVLKISPLFVLDFRLAKGPNQKIFCADIEICDMWPSDMYDIKPQPSHQPLMLLMGLIPIALHWCNLGGIKITIYQCYKEFQLRTNFFYKGYNLYGPHGSHAMFVAWCSSMSPTIYIDKNMIISLSLSLYICFFKSYWHTKSLQEGKLPCCVVWFFLFKRASALVLTL